MQETRRVASMEETQREATQRCVEVDPNVANFTRPEAMIHARNIFTEQDFVVLGGRTLQRACKDESHSVNVRALQRSSISLSPCP